MKTGKLIQSLISGEGLASSAPKRNCDEWLQVIVFAIAPSVADRDCMVVIPVSTCKIFIVIRVTITYAVMILISVSRSIWRLNI